MLRIPLRQQKPAPITLLHLVLAIKKTFRFIARLFTELLSQTVVAIGLMVLLGSAYTQVMIGFLIGFVLLMMGILMAKLM